MKNCIFFIAIALPIILSSNSAASERVFGHVFPVWAPDTSGQPGDSVRIVYDSLGMPIDTITQDSAAEPKPLFEDLITYNADDSIHFSIDGKKMFLYGNAYVKYITTELKANYIELDMEKKLAYATGTPDSTGKLVGTPDFTDNGQAFQGIEMRYNFDTKKGLVTDIVTQQGEGYLQGEITKKQNDSVYCVKKGMYTTCDQHDHPHFGIRMTKAKMIKDKKVITGPAYLEFEGIPLPLAIPFGFFPISKKGTSGIIMPTYGEERMRGFNLRNGVYYFYISDHVDLTLTGDIYSNGSWALGAASNYKKRYKFSGQFQGNISKNYVSEKGLPDYEESQDWSLRWNHSQDSKANPYATFSASVDMSSSSNNRYNPSSYNDIVNQRKQSSISWSKKWPDSPFSMSGSFSHSQNSSDTTISLTLPNFSLRMTQIYPFRKKGKVGEMKWYDNIGITYSAELRNNISCKEYDLMNSSFVNNWDNGFRHNIPVSLSFKIARDVTFTPWATVSGSSVRYNTGAHADLNSFNMLTGIALGKGFDAGRVTVGAFFEYGTGSYKTSNSFDGHGSYDGKGDSYYLGWGLLARMDFADTGPGHFYVEGSGRMGGLYNNYSNEDLRDGFGREAEYDSYAPYYSFHAGLGYIWDINEQTSLEFYGKYLWTRECGDSVTLSTGEEVDFEDIDSSRLRFGTRLDYRVNEYITPYIGVAWEHEFDGESSATTNNLPILEPDLRGDTGIGEIGLTITPSENIPLTVDLGLTGYVGTREGISGSLLVKWTF